MVLDVKYPGWRFATVSAELGAELRPDDHVDWIAGDFDADGRQDAAVQLVLSAGAPPDSAQLIVALLRREPDDAIFVVKTSSVQLNTYLRRGARGKRERDLERDSEGKTFFIYPSDAVEVLYGQEAGEACFFDGDLFKCRIVGD
jgi:hypothetical protein